MYSRIAQLALIASIVSSGSLALVSNILNVIRLCLLIYISGISLAGLEFLLYVIDLAQ